MDKYAFNKFLEQSIALLKAGQPEKAYQLLTPLFKSHSNNARLLTLAGKCQHLLRNDEMALALAQKALAAPEDKASRAELGMLFSHLSAFKQALAIYDTWLEKEPENSSIRTARAFIYLAQGHLLEGFKEYEHRLKLDIIPKHRHRQPRWQGEHLSKQTLLIHAEQGFGDNLQFVRYLPMVKQRCQKLILECPRVLIKLLSSVKGVDRCVMVEENYQAHDLQISLMSLPYIFETSLETIPCEIPYIYPSLTSKKYLPDSTKLKVGIAWAGSEKHTNDKNRSCPLLQFDKLLNISNIEFYSLQVGKPAWEQARLPNPKRLKSLTSHITDFSDTAAIMQEVDLIISVDTSIIHLAGALGKKAWLLLPYNAEWRWLIERSDSPWYPSLTLFRQPKPGDWESIFETLTEKLTAPA